MMLGQVRLYDVIFKLLLGWKNIEAGAAEERDKNEVLKGIDDLLHHQVFLHLHLLLMLLLPE